MQKIIPKLDDVDLRESWAFIGTLRRLAVGALLTFIVYQAFGHAHFCMVDEDSTTRESQVVLLSVAVFFGSLITGLANHRAEMTGSLLGVLGAGVLLGWEMTLGNEVPQAWWMGLPVMQGFVGIGAGLLGRLMFLPAPRCRIHARAATPSFPTKAKKQVPIGWARIFLAVVVANVALVYADPIRQTMATTLGRGVGSYGSGRLLVWQVTMLGSLIAGIVAGAGGKRGLRQGTIAGLFAVVGLVTAATKSGVAKIPAADFWIDQLNLEGATHAIYSVMAITMFVTMLLGGWMGAHLFPPRHKRR